MGKLLVKQWGIFDEVSADSYTIRSIHGIEVSVKAFETNACASYFTTNARKTGREPICHMSN